MTINPMQRADNLLRLMTLEEKAYQLSSTVPVSLFGMDGAKRDQLDKHLGKGIGHIAIGLADGYKQPSQLARSTNQIQRYLLDHTRLGIPAIIHVEALNGVVAPRFTSFPTAIALAATWNPDAVQQMADLIRRQMRSVGLHQALAPVMDVARDARWGRVHETYGEDPYLVSALSVAYVRGIQGDDLTKGAIATAKHFLGYAMTESGQNMAASHLTGRELYEVYARPFEAAIRLAGLGSVMNSYSELDGVPVGANVEILDTLLRDRLGFEGTVVADYGTVKNLYDRQFVARDREEAGVLALEAGLDVELPVISGYGDVLVEAVRKGLVGEDIVDRSVRRILRDKFALGLFDNPYVSEEPLVINRLASDGAALALDLARQSVTLLKNDGILPVSSSVARIAVIGPHARDVDFQFAPYTYPASLAMTRAKAAGGELTMAGLEGTEDLTPDRALLDLELNAVLAKSADQFVRDDYGAESIVEALQRLHPEAEITAVDGVGVVDGNDSDLETAVAAAKTADLVILALGGRAGWFVGGVTEGEGSDTANIELPSHQIELVKAVAATGTPTIGIVYSGRPFALESIVNDLSALVLGYYGGQRASQAMAEVLLGHVNPSGRLPYTVPRHSGQIPIYHSQNNGSGYRRSKEDIHRGYLDMPATPLFAFGHGLSYTSFEYANLSISGTDLPIDGEVKITVDIANVGDARGDEIAQLYFTDTATGVTRPGQELVAFHRVRLEVGETTTIEFTIQMSQLGYLGLERTLVLEPGPIKIAIGPSSDNLPLHSEFNVVGETVALEGLRTYLAVSRAGVPTQLVDTSAST